MLDPTLCPSKAKSVNIFLFANLLIKHLAFISTKSAFANILEKINYFQRFDSAKYSDEKSQFIGTTANYTNTHFLPSTPKYK